MVDFYAKICPNVSMFACEIDSEGQYVTFEYYKDIHLEVCEETFVD